MDDQFRKHYSTRECITTRNFIYHYIDSVGKEDSLCPVVLLLHGHGDFSFGWRDVLPVLSSNGIRCIAPDLLGFGKTSKPVDKEVYRVKLMCNDILELLSFAGIQDHQQIVVIGHDWGTHLASRLVLHYPSKFSAATLVGAPYLPPLPQVTSLDDFIEMFPNFAYWKFFVSESCPSLLRNNLCLFWKLVVCTGSETAVPMSDLERILTAAEPDAKPCERPTLWDQSTYDAYNATYLRGGWEAPMNWYKAFLDNFEDEKTFIQDPIVHHPMLLVIGKNDPAVPLEAVKSSEKFLASGTVVSLPCGHWIPQETGAELAQIVITWMQSLHII